MNIFDILGPVMVGPSSSHTAGAVRIGYVARRLMKEPVSFARLQLHGSFATTGKGHGTDRALIAGLCGMRPDDTRIPDSFAFANKAGLTYSFETVILKDAHPNTVLLHLTGQSGGSLSMQAASIGGGRILIQKLDGIKVNFSAERPTLVIHNQDRPGHVAKISSILSKGPINIGTLQLYRDKRGGSAVMVLEVDQKVPEEMFTQMEAIDGITKVTYIHSADS